MNTNSSKWAVEVGNANLSEAIQTIAFSYGYSWSGWGAKTVDNTTAKFLVFNPESKALTYGNYRYELEDTCSQVVTTFDAVMTLLKTPPTTTVKVGSDITVSKSGDVSVRLWTVGSDLFDKVVTARNTLLGKKNKLPVVKFTYTSQNSGRKTRNVMVTEMDADYISGLDMDADNKFKKFLVGKVGVGGVQLVSFADEP
jgi:hypothetical protein